MVQDIKETKTAYFGTYKFMNKDYKFHWFKETEHFIVNSDIWSCYINCCFDLMKAFSLACDKDFWKLGFKRKTHQPCALIGIVPVSDLSSPYDISNILNRRDDNSMNFMRYGSSSLVRLKKKKYVRAVKLRTANFDPDIWGQWNFYEARKQGINYIVKEEKILMNRVSTVKHAKFVSYTEVEGSCYTVFEVLGEEIAVRTNVRDFFSTRIYQVTDGFYFALEGDDPPNIFEEFFNNPVFQRQSSNYHGSIGMMSCVDFIHQISKMPVHDFIRVWLQEYEDFANDNYDDVVEPDDTYAADFGEIYS